MRLAPLAAAALLSGAAGAAPAPSPRIFDGVAVGDGHVVFASAGQIWRVPKTGGTAILLTDGTGENGEPVLSRDGRTLAFGRVVGGTVQVFVMPASGGPARRLTFHPKASYPRGFTPDGTRVLFASGREGDGAFHLFTVSVEGGPESELPLPEGYQGAFSEDDTRLAYVPDNVLGANVRRRFYRGGAMSRIRLAALPAGPVTPVTPKGFNALFPILSGGKLICATDRLGSFNLEVFDLAKKTSRALTSFRRDGITYAAGNGDEIAFVRDGRIHVLDTRTLAVTEPPIVFTPAPQELAKKSVPAARFLQSASLTPDGTRVVLEARGDVLLFDPATGSARNLTSTAGAAERLPVVSPDGKAVAYFSDESGEYRVCLRPLEGGPARCHAVEEKPTYYRGLAFSPDGTRLAFTDQRLRLLVLDAASGRLTVVDSSRYVAQDEYKEVWSPDGRYLVYSKAAPGGVRSLWIWDSKGGARRRVTEGFLHEEFPVFDASGRWLVFAASSNARNAPAADLDWGLESSQNAEPLVRKNLYVAVLSKTDVPPFLPGGRETFPTEPRAGAPPAIDLDGLSRRVVLVPTPVRDVVGLFPGPAGSVLVQVRAWPETPTSGRVSYHLLRCDLASPRKPIKLLEKVEDVSASGGNVLVSGDGLRLLPAASADGKDAKPVDLSKVTVDVDPAAEWRQIYREAFRLMRDTFYDPNHHGRDVVELERHYAAYLPALTRRADLTQLLVRAFGEISVSHLRVGGGDAPRPNDPPEKTGLLGADWRYEKDRVVLAKILRHPVALSPNELFATPFDQPGVDAREGDVLVAIDGQPVDPRKSVEEQMAGKAGKPTKVTLAAASDGADARTVTVVPLPGENTLRRTLRADEARRRVDALSGGRLAYVWLPGWWDETFEEFWSVWNASEGKEGFILDQRDNGGGVTADTVVNAFRARPVYAYAYRWGDDFRLPHNLVHGPKVVLVNEQDFSAAETFPLMAKLTKAATVVGKTTGGGGIGAALFAPRLVDGGVVRIPNRAAYNPVIGTWDVENKGVEPDVFVENSVEDWRAGRDRQLETAVAVALKALETRKDAPSKKPVPPVHPN